LLARPNHPELFGLPGYENWMKRCSDRLPGHVTAVVCDIIGRDHVAPVADALGRFAYLRRQNILTARLSVKKVSIAALRVNSTELADNPDADFSAVIRRMEELTYVKASD
jgi:hypothetical protein